jgi:hypothetical protein
MPKVSASNGIRPEIRALAVLQMGKTVTPKEINDHVGTGEYAAKYVSFLNTRYGFTITANKDGRKVVSYTMIAEPANAAELRAAQPKASKAKAAKVAKAPKAKAPKANITQPTFVPKAEPANAEDIKAKNLDTLRKVAADMGMKKVAAKKKVAKKVREFDDVTEQFGTSGEVATSFSIDKDWDSIDGVDLSKII